MTNAEYKKQRRARLTAEGICSKCLVRKATEGKKSCTECREYDKQYYTDNHDKLREYSKQYKAANRAERLEYAKQYDAIKRANDLCVVYAILIAGYKYIGSTHIYEKRKLKHLSDLRLGKHANIALQALYNEHGPDALEFVVLAELPKSTLKHDRLLLEQHFIDQTPADSCLNVHPAFSLDEAA